MKKLMGLVVAAVLVGVWLVQANVVLAKTENKGKPQVVPITSPTCKPGWGMGDTNHCHFGPPGFLKK